MNVIYMFVLLLLLLYSIFLGYMGFQKIYYEVLYDDSRGKLFDNLEDFLSKELEKNNSLENIFKIDKWLQENGGNSKYDHNQINFVSNCLYNNINKPYSNPLNLDYKGNIGLGSTKNQSIDLYSRYSQSEKDILQKVKKNNFYLIYKLLKNKTKENEIIISIKDESTGNSREFNNLNRNKNYSCVVNKAIYFENFSYLNLTDNCINEIFNHTINPINILCDSKKCLSLGWEFAKTSTIHYPFIFEDNTGRYYLGSSNLKYKFLHQLFLKYKDWNFKNRTGLKKKIKEREEKINDIFSNMQDRISTNSTFNGRKKYEFVLTLKEFKEITLYYNEIFGFSNEELIYQSNLENLRLLSRLIFFLHFHSCLEVDRNSFVFQKSTKLDCCFAISKRKTISIINRLPDFNNFLPNKEFYKECIIFENNDNLQIYDVIEENDLHVFSKIYPLYHAVSVKRIQKNFFSDYMVEIDPVYETEYSVKVCVDKTI